MSLPLPAHARNVSSWCCGGGGETEEYTKEIYEAGIFCAQFPVDALCQKDTCESPT